MKKFIFLLAFLSMPVSADLTATQYQAIKADIMANPAKLAKAELGDMSGLADLYNLPVADKCWDSNFSRDELLDVLNFTAYIARSAAEKAALELMFSTGGVDARRANIRAAFADIFSGTGAAAVNQRNALNSAMQRQCTDIEKVLASGNVNGAYVTTFEGYIGWPEVARAWQEY